MSGHVVSPSSIEDWPGIWLLLNQLWPTACPAQETLFNIFQSNLQSGLGEYWQVKEDGEVIGLASLSVKRYLWAGGNVCRLDELIVGINHRRRGIGEALVDKVIQRAGAHECRTLELDTAYHRSGAHSFYESVGFVRRAHVFSMELVRSAE
jgi:N-acetylglutamate synthase-like GNAT family acetyltransferase